MSHDGKEIARGKDPEFLFPTEKGMAYLVEQSASPVARMPFAPLAPAANQNVKLLVKPRGQPAKPAPRQPMLGITRDGVTPVRRLIQQNRANVAAAVREIIGDRKPQSLTSAKWTKADGAATPAPWLIDGIFDPNTIPAEHLAPWPAAPIAAYELELAKPAPVQAVVWSCDRNGIRCGANIGRLKTVVLQASADGTNWSPAGQAAWNHSWYG